MCFHITKYTYPIRQIPAFISPHTHFPSPFRGYLRICGTINRPLRLLTVCQLRGEHSANTQRPPTKCLTNTPPGVGADSSRPYPCINKYTYPHYRIYVSTLSHTHIHIIKYTHSFHRTRISPPPFRERLRICGHDKSGPYSC